MFWDILESRCVTLIILWFDSISCEDLWLFFDLCDGWKSRALKTSPGLKEIVIFHYFKKIIIDLVIIKTIVSCSRNLFLSWFRTLLRLFFSMFLVCNKLLLLSVLDSLEKELF